MRESRRQKDVLVQPLLTLSVGPDRRSRGVHLGQVGYWRDSMTPWQHAVKVTNGAYRAHNNLGVPLWEKGNGDEAVAQFREASRIKPDFANAHCNLATVLFMRGSYDQARREIEKCKVYGGTPNPQVLRELESRMPEPKGRPGR